MKSFHFSWKTDAKSPIVIVDFNVLVSFARGGQIVSVLILM